MLNAAHALPVTSHVHATDGCAECGLPFQAKRQHGEFCCGECRDAFNNRIKARGVLLYPLVMSWRYERPLAKRLRLFLVICRLCAQWRREDDIQRGGRPSWPNIRTFLARNTRFFAERIVPGERRDA